MPYTKKSSCQKYAIEYICTYCGKTSIKTEGLGRPEPGVCIKKGKTLAGKPKPHTWRRNRIV